MRYREIIRYLDALEEWTRSTKEHLQKEVWDKVEILFRTNLEEMGFPLYTRMDLQELITGKAELGTCRRWVCYLALFFASRDVFFCEYQDVEADLPPLIIDNIFGYWGKYELERISMFLEKRKEQIILLSNSDYVIEEILKSRINYKYTIIPNYDLMYSTIEP